MSDEIDVSGQVTSSSSAGGHIAAGDATGDVIHGDQVNNYVAPAIPAHLSTPEKWIIAPTFAPNSHFTGREDLLKQVHDSLTSDKATTVTQVFKGLGGVGKTQLVRQYAHLHESDYDHLIWLNCEERSTDSLLVEVAAGLAAAGFVEGTVADVETQKLLATQWLASTKNILVVLDNLESAEVCGQLLAICAGCGVLITTRSAEVANEGVAINVAVFDADTAVKYLTNSCPQAGSHEDALQLAERLGFLPLALSYARAYLSIGIARTYDEYLDRLVGLPTAELFKDQPDKAYQSTIAATWTKSIQAASQQATKARELLECFSLLAPSGIDYTWFTTTLGSQNEVRAAAEALADFSLIEPVESYRAAERQVLVSVHRLLQQVVREDLNSTQFLTKRLETTVDAIEGTIDSLDRPLADPKNWPLNELLLPQLEHVVSTTSTTLDEMLGSKLVGLANVSVVAADASRTPTKLPQTNMVFAEAVLGEKHPDTLTTKNNLAHSYRQDGRTKDAIKIQEQLLQDSIETLGEKHPDTLTTKNNLASSYRQDGRTKDAIKIQQQLLQDSIETLGEKHPDTLTTKNNLASSYRQDGRTKDAIKIQEQLLQDRIETLGEKHPNTLTTKNNLAVSYWQDGKQPEAKMLMQEAVFELEQTLGKAHPTTIHYTKQLDQMLRAGK